jgi:acetyltransferase-like isoleucine patch superfamily enzyme
VEPRPVRIGSNAWIGFEACLLPGVAVGEGAIVGARSVVAEDVPAYTVVAGNPARVIRHC